MSRKSKKAANKAALAAQESDAPAVEASKDAALDDEAAEDAKFKAAAAAAMMEEPGDVDEHDAVSAEADADADAAPAKRVKKASKKAKRSAPSEDSDTVDTVELLAKVDHTEHPDILSNSDLAAALEAAAEGDAAPEDGETVEASSDVDDPVGSIEGDGEGEGDGDDVVGEPITDEAGVEAALLPSTLTAVQLRHLIEALVFAADKPVTIQRLRQLTRISDVKRIEQALAELAEDYKDRGIALATVSGGYQFRTNTAFSSWVQQLIAGRPVRLSRAQLETLAIVAYRQPITRPEIDEIRGVDSSNTLRLLLDRSLIRVLGKREEVGRPTLYGTTKEFLDFFSLGDLRELPTLREYSELTAESRQVMSDRLGVSLDDDAVQIDPETGEPIDGGASTIDTILAEHAAAEAGSDRHQVAHVDAGAVADAALAGGSHLERVADDADDADDDAMAMSGEMTSFPGHTPPDARSLVDAIRESAFADEVAAEEREARAEVVDAEPDDDGESGSSLDEPIDPAADEMVFDDHQDHTSEHPKDDGNHDGHDGDRQGGQGGDGDHELDPDDDPEGN